MVLIIVRKNHYFERRLLSGFQPVYTLPVLCIRQYKGYLSSFYCERLKMFYGKFFFSKKKK